MVPRLTKTEGAIIAIASIVLLGGIGGRPLFNFDEALYAQAAKEMVQSGNFLTPRWNGEFFFHKPPLLLWLTAICYKLLGISEFSARLTSSLAGIGSALLTYKIGVRLYSPFVAVAACLILLTSGLFIAESTYGRTDSLLLFFSLLAFYSYLKAEENRRWWFDVVAALAMAAMTKGLAAAVPTLVIAVSILLDRRRVDYSKAFKGLVVFGPPVLAWHGYMLITHGRAFFNEYYLHQGFARALGVIEGMASGYGYYFRVLVQYFHPWCYLAPFALAFVIWKRERSYLLLVSVVLVFGLFSFAGTKLSSYILPLIPALAILIARLFALIRPAFAIPALGLLALIAVPKVIKVRTPHIDFVSVKRLGLKASHDSGPLFTAPGLYCAPEIRFYSDRRVCARDDRGNTISMLTQCATNEPTNTLFRESELSKIQVIYDLQPIDNDGSFIYGAISEK
ncbi:MAG: ArnT family glycosyltransferase [Pyrinomonadaceae bacterium]